MTEEAEQLGEALAAAVANGEREQLRTLIEGLHPADLTTALDGHEPEVAWRTLAELSADDRAEAFGYLDPERQIELAQHLDRRQLAHVFRYMPADERVDLFQRLSPEQQDELLPSLAQAERDDIRRLASHEEGTAGAIMTSEYATLAPELTATESIERLRREAPDKETIYQAYVVDANRRLLGTVSLRDLIVARGSTRVSELMTTEVIALPASAGRDEAATLISRYDLIALPIVDEQERLIGIVTYDDAMDVAEAEATEDFDRIGAVNTLDTSVRAADIQLLYRKRIVWLVILVFANALSGTGIAAFEETITAHVALVFFLPLLIASSGNAGAQAATLTVRALATGDVQLSDWGRMLARELCVALLLGITMAFAVSLLGFVRTGPEIALVAALTMVSVVVLGSLLGMSLPFVLERFRLDPATASAPLVTSLADICGVVIYFWIASRLLPAVA